MRDGHKLPLEIDRFHFSREEVDPLQEFSNGIDDICKIKIAGRDFMQHGGKQKEVVAVDQRNLDVGIAGQGIVEVNRRMQPGKATAENENPSFLLRYHLQNFPLAT